MSFHSAGEALLPQAIAALRRSMPGVHVRPIVDEAPGAARRLRAGEADVVVVTVEPFGAGAEPDDDLRRTHLLDDEHPVLLPHDHPAARPSSPRPTSSPPPRGTSPPGSARRWHPCRRWAPSGPGSPSAG